jgi:hypothetical protein
VNEELKEIFKICDTIMANTQIDYDELINQSIDNNFFNNYQNTRVVNSFLFNFAKLQDKIGAKLFRKILYEYKEIDNLNLPMIDILNLLEKLKILEDKNSWDRLREIRNSLAHEYPFDIDERVQNIQLALNGFTILKEIYFNLTKFSKNSTSQAH